MFTKIVEQVEPCAQELIMIK